MGNGPFVWNHFDDIGNAFSQLFNGQAANNWNSLNSAQKSSSVFNSLLPGFDMFDLNGSSAAQTQYQNQLALNQQSQAFNASEAEKQREFEKMLASTAYQRQVADMKAAGLNPYALLANASGGAAVPSGSSASSSSGSADMANNKLTAAAGVIALVLRILLSKK